MHLFMKISSLLEDIIYFFTNHLSGWNSWAFLLIGFRSRVFVIYVTGHRILYMYIYIYIYIYNLFFLILILIYFLHTLSSVKLKITIFHKK